ncbi:MAG: DNA methyltransferase [Chloroflexi bacterium]|nr:DNA methyltransferase [Chloroflexota bacterium]
MNRILYAADCLDVLNDADELPSESVDLIYLDPPFNSNSSYNLPFKGRDKSLKPVEAFKDTWAWTAEDKSRLEEMGRDPRTRSLATIVKFAAEVEGKPSGRGKNKTSLASYLLHMALRLRAMRRALKKTGSIYLHCDPTAGHYLKLVMDAIYGQKNYRNTIIWKRTSSHNDAKRFGNVHDELMYYTKENSPTWNTLYLEYDEDYVQKAFRYQDDDGRKWASSDLTATSKQGGGYEYEWNGVTRLWLCPVGTMERLESENRLHYTKSGLARRKRYLDEASGVMLNDVWTDINPIGSHAKERLGYPTQKPLALLERIISASSNPGDLVLDPFCGCGTTVHAAEALRRRWIGIDISPFSTGLIRERIAHNFPLLSKRDISIRGIPETIQQARDLARRDKFEFEKWVCGFIGAEGMFRQPGERGADGGVDGLLKFYRFVPKKVAKAEYAVVQVKGGKVSPDAVRALRETVDRLSVTAGVLVCFRQYMSTVDNQRSHDSFDDVFGSYPVIQGYSIEDLLANKPLDLPTYGRQRQGALLDL